MGARKLDDSLVLSKDELRSLSGCARHREQQEWLRQQRIPFLLGADGMPKVLRATITSILGAPAANDPQRGPKLRLSK